MSLNEAPHEVAGSRVPVRANVALRSRRTWLSSADRHVAAVTRSLGWAVESAARGDYVDALAWLRTIEATGDQLPPAFESKRRTWLGDLARQT